MNIKKILQGEKNRKFGIVFWSVLIIGLILMFQRQRTISKNNFANNQNSFSSSAIIIPHFDFFKDKRQEFLKSLENKDQVQQIILFSVNHKSLGQADIITTDQEWDYGSQKINVDKNLIKSLTTSTAITNDQTVFLNEHGIKNVLGEVAENFAKASITPLTIKDTSSKTEIDQLFDIINQNCPKCLLIASVDFSHYCPNSLAQVHDKYSISALENNDLNKVWQAETDSPQSLYLASKWAKRDQNQNFNLFYNSNSGEVNKDDSMETTSTIIGGFSDQKNQTAAEETTFVVGGDLMFDRNVNHNYKDAGLYHVFDKLGDRPFWGVDISLANLEGPISEAPIDDVSTGSLVFNFPPETVGVLNREHFKILSLANNHTLNAGTSGFQTTKKLLKDAGLKYVGSQEEFNFDSLLQIDGPLPMSIIALDQLVNPDQTTIAKMIQTEKSAGRKVLIFPHWGVEYQSKHSSDQQSLAHSFIDAGADIVIGSHPHVTEDFEVYKNRPIVYSLGNFVFDQYFSKETQEGLIVAGTISEKSIKLSFLPIKSSLSQPQFMTGKEKADKIKTVVDLNSESGFKKVNGDTLEIGLRW